MVMGLEFTIIEELRTLTPIKTKTKAKAASREETEKGINEEDENCVTPKAEESELSRPAAVCPPAPRKPRPVKRRSRPPPVLGFYKVPTNLTKFFVPAEEVDTGLLYSTDCMPKELIGFRATQYGILGSVFSFPWM
ncbi:uncharacterized protein A4U43_C01F490 [Asparagus officinalis]|uniref:Uncharacterized protein n=1 Tax=Asparagus officinalis TaxID=4686 RepID=A0A5P1FN72_ASPOF|nr:uncharacterized protein A4U43_C01F490 [Asparagus officinalis]